MTTVLPLPGPRPLRRLAPYKSYDKSVGMPPGLWYARHAPEVAERIDRLELARCLPKVTECRRAAALIVALYHHSRPTITHAGKTIPIKFQAWERASQPEKWLLYTAGAADGGAMLNRAVTLHLPAEDVYRTHSPARVMGDFINDKLEPIYRRAGASLSFAYKIEMDQAYDRDEARKLLRAETDLVAFHGTLLLHVPEELEGKVIKMLARYAATTPALVRRRRSGTLAHIAQVHVGRRFGVTQRRALLGVADYAAKDFHKLHAVAQWEKEHYAAPLNLDKLCGASRDVAAQAKALYGDLRKWIEPSPRDAVRRAVGAQSAFSACAMNEMETVQRILRPSAELFELWQRIGSEAAFDLNYRAWLDCMR